jgi:CubicO group peptidase (beta-lactamase class C family)
VISLICLSIAIRRDHRVAVGLVAVLFIAVVTRAGQPLPRATPESQGVSSAQVQAYVEAADAKVDTMHGFVLVRHGNVVAEGWWKPQSSETPHAMHSLSKSFTSTAVGFAVSEGKFSVDDLVLKFFQEDAPEKPTENLRKMRVRDLLTMSTGHRDKVPLGDEVPWTQSFLRSPVEFKPGTHFFYNSAGTYMLSAIVQKTTGQTVLDYLRPRLFEPLGIDDATWMTSPQGIATGGWGLSLRTEDIAKFGLLYLQKGKWNGKQLIPESWVEMATSKQTSTGSDPASDWDQGYGFQFWRCRHGAFRGDGAFGQFCIMMPEQDAVLAITADNKDMQRELNVVWDNLLPAFHGNPMPEDPQELEKLKRTIIKLQVKEAHVINVIDLPGIPASKNP